MYLIFQLYRAYSNGVIWKYWLLTIIVKINKLNMHKTLTPLRAYTEWLLGIFVKHSCLVTS